MIDWLTYLDQLTPDWLTSEATRKSIIRYDDTRNKAQFVFVVVKVTPVFCLLCLIYSDIILPPDILPVPLYFTLLYVITVYLCTVSYSFIILSFKHNL